MENNNFLQSEEWRKFQEKTGKRTFHIEHDGFSMNILEHTLPVVGRYFYVPRGVATEQDSFLDELVSLAKKENVGWVRFDLNDSRALDKIRDNWRIAKAPHDMQPKEIFVMDITKPEEELLAEMKSKTRYNIKLAEKKSVKISCIKHDVSSIKYFEEFIELVELTAKRKGISFHPGDYYRKMMENLPSEMLSLYIAEYNGKIIAANLMIFYGDTAIYLHGATDDEYRNVMAPYLLQWQAILDAKKRGCKFYDFGGVKTCNMEHKACSKNGWAGITKFKLGFSQTTKPIEFSGSYDIVISPVIYWVYRGLQKIKSFC